MNKLKTKMVATMGGLGALCALCCALPVMGFLGLGTLEALFCENQMLQGMGLTLALGSVVYFIYKTYKEKITKNACALSCACKAG